MHLCQLNDSYLRERISYTWGVGGKALIPGVFIGRAYKPSLKKDLALMKKSQPLAEFPIYHLCITPQNCCLEKSLSTKAFSASKQLSRSSSRWKSADQLGWSRSLTVAYKTQKFCCFLSSRWSSNANNSLHRF